MIHSWALKNKRFRKAPYFIGDMETIWNGIKRGNGICSLSFLSVHRPGPAFNIRPLEDLIANTLQQQRLRSFVVGAFAALVLLLAFIGIYGVVAFSVNRRVREIGIRMAFGATKTDILKMILRETMITCAFGIILGVAGAIAAGRILASFLFGVTSYDPATFVAAVVFAAGFIPAYRAASADPATCLHHE